ncbi:MAG TPA: adenylyl-sulfate kinase [Acidobacteriota bacterium]|nr:adenylyl-sulfate kinase [Acidobacteriota bacterium]
MKEAFVIWLTGIPASGKSTIGKSLITHLRNSVGVPVVRLESDELRSFLTPQPTYSNEERDYFYGVIANLARLLVENEINVVIDATANRSVYRERARSLVGNFLEVWLKCPVEICIQRDPKGIYRKAAQGATQSVPGVQEEYEEPKSPEVTIESDKVSTEESAALILKKLGEKGWI